MALGGDVKYENLPNEDELEENLQGEFASPESPDPGGEGRTGDNENDDHIFLIPDGQPAISSWVRFPFETSMAYWRQLWALFYKDFIIRKFKRHYVLTALEALVPITLLSLLVYLRYRSINGTAPERMGPDVYPENHLEAITLLANDTMAYAPDTNYTRDLARHLEGQTLGPCKIEAYESWDALNKALDHGPSPRVTLNLERVNENSLNYVLSIDAPNQFSTKKFAMENGPRKINNTSEVALLYPLMWNIFQHFVLYYHNETIAPPILQPQPTGTYLKDLSFEQLARFLAQFLLFSYVVFIGVFPMQIIQEKSSRIRELLRMMGQSEMVYWNGIFLTGFVSMLFIAILATAVFTIPIMGYPILVNSDPLVLFFILIAFSVAAILQLILLSVIFNGPTMGAMISILVWFLSLTLCVVLLDTKDTNTYMQTTASVKYLIGMLPPCGLYWAFKLIGFWESANMGIQFSNLCKYAAPGDNITMMGVLLMFMLSTLVLSILIFYLDAVLPWQYGIPKDPWFIFQRSYWTTVSEKKDLFTSQIEDPTMFEAAPRCADRVVVVDRVSKRYGKKAVVDNLSVSFFKNQISVILGHNGAGKTTTMNILTGLFPPTSGDIFINGYSIRENMRKARESIGLCPQHNVLFDDLTVEEHLRYFAVIKKAKNADAEIEDLLNRLNLVPKRHFLAKNLSGGMKRKLSMANAMIGGSELLILDEPTAGMDPQARREIWSILQEARKTRTILLTTHYMEEADVLGDRIAFLANGRLKCVGSPMFLKKKFNTGYKMRVVKASPGMEVNDLQTTVTSHLAGCVVEADMNHEIVFNLGFPPTRKLVELFHHLEDNKIKHGIADLGVSVTTMEDVFLAVGSDENSNGLGISSTTASSLGISSALSSTSLSTYSDSSTDVDLTKPFPQIERTEGMTLAWQQFMGLFCKRFNSVKRQWWMPVFLFALPVALTAAFCALDEWNYKYENQITLPYSMYDIYGNTKGWFSSRIPTNSSLSLYPQMSEYMGQEHVQDTVIPEQNFTEFLIKKSVEDSLAYKMTMMMGLYEGEDTLTLWVNDQPYHSAPSALVILQRALFEHYTGKKANIEVATHPRDSLNLKFESTGKLVWVRFVAVFPISLATAFLTCAIVLNPIEENMSKAKLVQLMSGVSRAIYFGTNFIFDGILMMASTLAMLATILLYNPLDSFTVFNDTWGATLLILWLYAYAMTPFSYLTSYLFNKPSTGFMYLLVFNVLTGSILVVIMAMLDALSLVPDNPFQLNLDAVDWSLHMLNYIPSFSVVWGFVNVHVNGLARDFCRDNRKIIDNLCMSPGYRSFVEPCCQDCGNDTLSDDYNPEVKFCYKHTSAFAFSKRDGAGLQLLALFTVGTILFIVLILMESKTQRVFYLLTGKRKRNRDSNLTHVVNATTQMDFEDEDVQRERHETNEIVKQGSLATSGHALVAHGLTKMYGNFRAVDNISFRVHKKECFGLLGVNGAGKTTTFGMLTGDLLCSQGNSYIDNTDLHTSLQKFQRNIGYCPQGNALIDKMTGREMIRLFCSLRGVPRSQMDFVTAYIIAVADLVRHADKTTDSYSGGTKRKLSIALTLAGNPKVLFLDEPTAGVDPSARRKIWQTLQKVQKDLGSAIVLTSHSMEECEALCGRVCIMVNGRFRCIGSSQQLKSKFGEGFTVLIKLNIGQDYKAPKVFKLLEECFPGHVKLREQHQSLLHFQVTDTTIRWGDLFQKVDDINQSVGFEDVLVSDTTLEQIFISFAKTQRDPDELVNASSRV